MIARSLHLTDTGPCFIALACIAQCAVLKGAGQTHLSLMLLSPSGSPVQLQELEIQLSPSDCGRERVLFILSCQRLIVS